MPDKLMFSFRDFDNDRQQFSLDMLEGADLATEFTAINTELQKWLCGSQGSAGTYEELVEDSGVAASTPIAQSRSQAIVEYKDSVTGKGGYIKRLPFPDMAKADDGSLPPNPAFSVSGGLTVFNPDHTDYPLLVAALENAWVSPAGNGVQVTRIYIEE